MYITRSSLISFLLVSMLYTSTQAQAEELSPTKKYIVTHVLPAAAIISSITAGLYTIAVFTKSQVGSPAARFLLTPIGAGATYGAACVPYLCCATLANYIQSKPDDLQFLFNTAATGSKGLHALKKCLIAGGMVGAAICVAALCGNKHASELLEWANNFHITFESKKSS